MPAPIFRAPMRADARRALRQGLVGIREVPGEKGERMLRRFAGLPDGTYVWTRTDDDGMYHLGRIAGEYRYDEAGLHHVRPADWLERPFAEDEVPPAVAATFARGGGNLQRTHDAAAERRTEELWKSRARRA
jgi:hypothetical protein